MKLLIAETVVVKDCFKVLYWLMCLKRLIKTTKCVLLTNTNDQLKILVFTLFAAGEKQFCGTFIVDMGIQRECSDSLAPRICHILYEPFYST
jgi:hypothetical protein